MMEHRQNSYQTSCRATASASNTASAARTASPSPSIPCKKELMDNIYLYSFAVNEANLFLNTHPYDTEALAYFQKYRALRVEAVKEYAKHYAPLAIDYATCEKTPWSWANEPWPWEGVEC